ncbi:hypothetical protein F5Y01DRAFT_312733 [Xylaria sp. FL0043]|nr:hypothetical protein F5Y01DRAFT_312733 [Xylaria sp. FL0043]
MADRIVKPDLPHTLSMTEQRIFDNFSILAEMSAENSVKLETLEKAIARIEEKIDSMQGSPSTVDFDADHWTAPAQPDPQKQAFSSQLPPVGLNWMPEPSSRQRPYEIRPTEPHSLRSQFPDVFPSFATIPQKRKLDVRDLLPDELPVPLGGIPLSTPEYSWSGTFGQLHKDTTNMEDHRKKATDKVKELAYKYQKDMEDMYKEIASSTAAANSLPPPRFWRPVPRPTALASPSTLIPPYRSMAGSSSLRTESSPPKTNLTRPAGVSKRVSKGKAPKRSSVENEDVEDDENKIRGQEEIGWPIDSTSLDMGTFP